MSRYISTKRSNPCPVCGDSKGKCRTLADSRMVYCMENMGIGRGAILNGYYCLGDTSNDLWAKFIPEDERREFLEHWSDQKRQEWIASQRRLETQRASQELERRARSLLVEQRDVLYRQLLDELTLHPVDKADLLRRGYSEQKIKEDGYKSVQQWQRLSREYNTGLPGVQLNGRSLNVPYPGYLCPVKDENGRIAGVQIRNRNPNAKRDGEPKYYWLTSKTKKRSLGPTAHLYPEGCDPEGELPLAIFQLPDTPLPPLHPPHWGGTRGGTGVGIALVEGTGPKPSLAGDRLGVTVLGAAGGLWASSPATLKSTLDNLRGDGPKEVTLYPDGGDVSNRHTMMRDRNLYDLLSAWGYSIKVAWWGQIGKGKDIDNLSLEEVRAIRTITWDEFWAIALQHCPKLRGFGTHKTSSRKTRQITADEWWARFGLPNEVKGLCDRLGKVLFRERQKAEGRGQKLRHQLQTSALNAIVPLRFWNRQIPITRWPYKLGNLPTPDRWLAMDCPTIEFERGQRLQVIGEALEKGYRKIFDSSLPGSGKSSDMGNFQPENARTFYAHPSHRNPTVVSIETNYEDAAVKHGGLVRDPSKPPTPQGNLHVRHPRDSEGEQPDIPANCPDAKTFQLAQARGILTFAGNTSPICQRCPKFPCGYLGDRARQWDTPNIRLRTHLNAMSEPSQEDVVIVDEAMATIEVTQSTRIPFEELANLKYQVKAYCQEANLPDYSQGIDWIIGAIACLMRSPNIPEHGLHQSAFLSALLGESSRDSGDRSRENLALPFSSLPAPSLGSSPATFDRGTLLYKLQERLEIEVERLGIPFFHPPDNDGVRWRKNAVRGLIDVAKEALKPNLWSLFQGTTSPVVRQKMLRMYQPYNWLVPILETIAGDRTRTSFAFNIDGSLTITKPSYRHRQIIDSARTILLDATATKEDLAVLVDADKDSILEIREQAPKFDNLHVHVIEGFGSKLGRQRRSGSEGSAGDRLSKLKQFLATKHSSWACLDLKQFQSEGEGYYWADSRGTNRYKDVDALLLVGSPMENLGSLASVYQAITGKWVSPADLFGRFGAWVRRRTQSEILQSGARLRSQWCNGEKHLYLVGSECSTVSRLHGYFPGCQLYHHQIIELCPEAAPKKERLIRGILEFLKEAIAKGQNPTIKEVAKEVSRSEGRITQAVKEALGMGFKILKKSLILLIESLNNKIKLEDLPEEARWLAGEYFPLLAGEIEAGTMTIKDVARELEAISSGFGRSRAIAILAHTDLQSWIAAFKCLLAPLLSVPGVESCLKSILNLVPTLLDTG